MLRSEEAVVVPSIEGGMLVDPDMNLCGPQWEVEAVVLSNITKDLD